MTAGPGKSVAVATTAPDGPFGGDGRAVRWLWSARTRTAFDVGRGAQGLEAFPNRVQSKQPGPEGVSQDRARFGPYIRAMGRSTMSALRRDRLAGGCRRDGV